MAKLDNEDKKLLQQYADNLPCVMVSTHEVHIMKGSDLLEMGFVEHDNEKIIPGKNYEYLAPVQVAMNHFNGLKRAWLRNGQKGLTEYFKRIATLIKKNKDSDA